MVKRDSITFLENEKIQKSIDYVTSIYNIPDKFLIEEVASMMKDRCVENQIAKKLVKSR